MGKTLLKAASKSIVPAENEPAVPANDKKTLNELMKEMKSHLDHAAQDLLQPREETLKDLLSKVLH